MPSNLQDFSREQLSPDFIARFSTDLFSEEVEEWFKYATESVIPMYEQVSRFTSKESNKEFTKQMKILCNFLQYKLDSSISKKQKLQKQGMLNLTFSELAIISESSKIHTNLAIFDWIHQYSSDKFPREIDYEMIHLIFDFIGNNLLNLSCNVKNVLFINGIIITIIFYKVSCFYLIIY